MTTDKVTITLLYNTVQEIFTFLKNNWGKLLTSPS